MPTFDCYIGIDYSGAGTPTDSLSGLRVYVAGQGVSAVEILPPPGPKKYWTRRGVAEWLLDRLSEDQRCLIGIDHGFSFPIAYFEKHGLKKDWGAFLEDFQRHWPTEGENTYVDFIREGELGNGSARQGDRAWKRLTEKWAGTTKSVFWFDVQGSVAKSTHAGLPWLRHIRSQLPNVHFWPFDGWEPPQGNSVIVEAYPALWSRRFPKEDRTQDQQDAYAVAEWLRRMDARGTLEGTFKPSLEEEEKAVAEIEGWILGVM